VDPKLSSEPGGDSLPRSTTRRAGSGSPAPRKKLAAVAPERVLAREVQHLAGSILNDHGLGLVELRSRDRIPRRACCRLLRKRCIDPTWWPVPKAMTLAG
jgi:hypothetical protein